VSFFTSDTASNSLTDCSDGLESAAKAGLQNNKEEIKTMGISFRMIVFLHKELCQGSCSYHKYVSPRY
jgi:hypothetical protein